MTTPSRSHVSDHTTQSTQLEAALTHGMASVRAGLRTEARAYLQKAQKLAPDDARPWLWLATTAPDADSQRKCLELALAADPHNPTAAEALKLFLDTAPDHTEPIPDAPTQAPQEDQPSDEVLALLRFRHWMLHGDLRACEQCGSIARIAPGQAAKGCPLCGGSQGTPLQQAPLLVDPPALVPMQVTQAEAEQILARWLRGNFFTPPDLAHTVRTARVGAAYYPFWCFHAQYIAHWSVEVETRSPHQSGVQWITHQGEHTLLFDEVLVSGINTLSMEALKTVAPQELDALVEFAPPLLDQHPMVLYDRPCTDASLEARERMLAEAPLVLAEQLLTAETKRDFQIDGGDFTSLTCRFLLFPFWVINYTYQGQEYRAFINGASQQIGGTRPRDRRRMTLVIGGVVLLSLIMALLLWRANLLA